MVELNFHCINKVTLSEPRPLSHCYVRDLTIHSPMHQHPITITLYSDTKDPDQLTLVRVTE